MRTMVISPLAGQTGCSTAALFMSVASCYKSVRPSSYLCMNNASAESVRYYLGIKDTGAIDDIVLRSFSNMITDIEASISDSAKSSPVRGFSTRITENSDYLPMPEEHLTTATLQKYMSTLLSVVDTTYECTYLDFGTDYCSDIAKHCMPYMDSIIIVVNQSAYAIKQAVKLKKEIEADVYSKQFGTKRDGLRINYLINNYRPNLASYKKVAKSLGENPNNVISVHCRDDIIAYSNSGSIGSLLEKAMIPKVFTSAILHDMKTAQRVMRSINDDLKGR